MLKAVVRDSYLVSLRILTFLERVLTYHVPCCVCSCKPTAALMTITLPPFGSICAAFQGIGAVKSDDRIRISDLADTGCQARVSAVITNPLL